MKTLASPLDGLSVPKKATTSSGQNAENPAKPMPVAAITSAAASSSRRMEKRFPQRPIASVMNAEPRSVWRRARVDELHLLARREHRLHLVDRHAGQLAELLLHQPSRRLDLAGVVVAILHCLPVDIAHEGVDVGLGIGAEIDVVRVLEHIECQDRNPA